MAAARSILALAPHPDDEVVAYGIAAMRECARGARIHTLCLTTGVPARELLWPWQRPRYERWVSQRREEALAAAALIGFAPFRFLDIPTRRLRHHLEMAASCVARALNEVAADALWVTAFEGAHQDHDAANAVAARFRRQLPVWEFPAYNFAGGRASANRFADARGGERVVEATASEAALKRRALSLYASERGNLRHIGCWREAWRPLPAHDYEHPPHPGLLFRERFHWVPFRHPRIDFDASATVYQALGEFAGAPALSPDDAAGPFDERAPALDRA